MMRLTIILTLSFWLTNYTFTQWHQTSEGIHGGKISALFIDSATNYLYAGSYGVVISKDYGATWKNIDSTLVPEGRYVYSIAVRGNCILLGTSTGVFSSNDAGRTWTLRNNGLFTNPMDPNMIVYSFTFKGSGTYIGTTNGVFFSSDTGKYWVPKSNGLTDGSYNLNTRDLVFIGNKLVAATSSKGAFISKDMGNTWTPSVTGLTTTGKQMRSLSLSGNKIFAGTNGGVYVSADSGNTWQVKSGTAACMSISSSGDTLLAATSSAPSSSKVYLSTDNGASWIQMNIPQQTGIKTLMHKGRLFAGADGFFRSTDGGSTWETSNKGLMKLGVVAMCVSGNSYFAGTSSNGIFISADYGDTWSPVNNGLSGSGLSIRTLAVKNDTIFAGTYGSGVFVSTNKGADWIPASSGMTGLGLRVQAMVITGNTILAGTDGMGVYTTNNNGSTWTQVVTQPIGGKPITSMVLSGNKIYAGSHGYGVFVSADKGQNWTDISGNITYKYIECIAVTGSSIFAGTLYQNIFRSDDNGNTWKTVKNGIRTDLSGKMIYSLYSKGSIIYAGTGSGAYMSYDKGENWLPMNTGIANLGIEFIEVYNNYMFAGTIGDGLWKRSFSDPTSLPAYHRDNLRIYPNPVRDQLTINYDDLNHRDCTMQILNLAGVVLYQKKIDAPGTAINLGELKFRGFCILKVVDSKGNIIGIQRIIKL